MGAVSVAADTYTRLYVGLTVFGNEKEQRDIRSWELDRVYADQLGEAAAAALKATYVRGPYATADFAPVNDLTGPWDAPAFWGPNFGKIERAARDYCAANELDALFVAAKQKNADVIGRTNQPLEALGIYGRFRPVGDAHYVLYASFRIGLLDCKTGRVVDSIGLGYVRGDRAWTGAPPMHMPPVAVASKPPSQWDAKAEATMRDYLTTLPMLAWEKSINAMVNPPPPTPPAASPTP